MEQEVTGVEQEVTGVGQVGNRAGTIYQYIDISQYCQSQYNIDTSYYSIEIF